MPVSFATSPTTSHVRRPSASAPFPGRVMTSLRPSDLPTKPKRSSSASMHRTQASLTRAVHPTEGVPEDPFEEDAGASAMSRAAMGDGVDQSPQQEHVSIYTTQGDAERQPLLGYGEEEEEMVELDERSPAVAWGMALGLTLAIAIATAVILYVFRVGEEDREGRV